MEAGLRAGMEHDHFHPGSASAAEALAQFDTENGKNLLEIASQTPVLLLFLRHFGCSFCRQTLDRVAKVRPQLRTRGVALVFVHLGTPERAKPYFDHYGLSDVERVSDPEASLYRHPAFALGRTPPWTHFFRPAVVKAWMIGAGQAYGIGLIREDAHQMPGAFFLRSGRIVDHFHYRTIADRPDYLALCSGKSDDVKQQKYDHNQQD